MAAPESPSELAVADLTRVGRSLTDFAADMMQDPREKLRLLRSVEGAIRRFEFNRGVMVID